MCKKILYIQYANPAAYPPVEHSSHILADAGWEVLFLGITPVGNVQTLQFPAHPHIHVQQLPAVSVGWRQKLHYLYFILWVTFKAIWWRPNWLYASDLFSCPATLLLSVFSTIKISYHEHDSPSSDATSAFMQAVLWSRQQIAKRVNICILPNKQRAQQLVDDLSPLQPPSIVWNCPRQDEIVAKHNQNSQQLFSIWYHGTIVPQRIPFALLDALATLPPQVSLHITGYSTSGHPHYANELRTYAEQISISSRVFIHPPLSRHLLMKQCGHHHVGLSFMPPSTDDINMHYMTGASNKPFDYLACGLALLVSNLPDWEEMFVDSGYGLACDPDDPESIAAALRWFWEHPQERQAMGEQGQKQIQDEWNYEAQFTPLLAQMEAML